MFRVYCSGCRKSERLLANRFAQRVGQFRLARVAADLVAGAGILEFRRVAVENVGPENREDLGGVRLDVHLDVSSTITVKTLPQRTQLKCEK